MSQKIKIKNIVIFLKILLNLVLIRSYGNIIHDFAQKYNTGIGQFRKFEKLCTKTEKAEADILFLKNCQLFSVYPKFVTFRLPNVDTSDIKAIRKRLLRSALQKRIKEKNQLQKERTKLENEFRSTITWFDWLILKNAVKKNVQSALKKATKTHEKKLQNLTKNNITPFHHNEIIKNLSAFPLTQDELDILKHGLNHSIPPKRLIKSDILTTFEMVHRCMKEDLKEGKDPAALKAELAHMANCYYYNYTPSRNTLQKHNILTRLKKNSQLVILKPDKGNGVVVMNRVDYDTAIYNIINDTSKFKKLSKDVTKLREGQLQRFMRKLKSNSIFNESNYKSIYPSGSNPARIYGLPKMHKKFESLPKFRPIVSSIGCFNYELSSFLGNLLKPYVSTELSPKDSFTFVEKLKKVRFNDSFLISFDVESLFTNIPLEETINLAVDTIFENEPNIAISKENLKRLFLFATSNTHFLFNGDYYEQIDGVAMGSPLAPTLANFFMGYHEKKWLEEYSGNKPLFYQRYVDDIFATFNNKQDADLFFAYLNTKHPNIKFTFEAEQNGVLPFLDVYIDINNNSLTTNIFRKSTYTGLLTNYFSFTSFSYKLSLIRTLCDRVYKLNNSWQGIHNDFEKTKNILKKNMYPPSLIDRTFKNYLKEN